MFGIAALIGALFVSVYDAVTYHEAKAWSSYPQWEIKTYPKFFGSAAFLYLIHIVVLPSEQTMSKRSEFPVAINRSVIFVTVLNLAYALVVYAYYGQSVRGNAMDNLEAGFLKTLIRLLLSIDLLCTGALFLLPVSRALEQELEKRTSFFRSSNLTHTRLLQTLSVVLISCIAVLVPDFALLTGLSGGFGNNIIGFLLPALIYCKLQFDRGYFHGIIPSSPLPLRPEEADAHPRWRDSTPVPAVREPSFSVRVFELLLCAFVIVFSVLMMLLTTTSFVEAISRGETTSSC